jgi:hypothetical protein
MAKATKGGRQKKPIVVCDREGKQVFLHVKHSLIHPLVVMCDGLTLTYFGREGPYLTVEQVRDWHLKELAESGGRSGRRDAADACQKVLDAFAAGEIVFDWDSGPPVGGKEHHDDRD